MLTVSFHPASTYNEGQGGFQTPEDYRRIQLTYAIVQRISNHFATRQDIETAIQLTKKLLELDCFVKNNSAEIINEVS
jgi:hypothetical protein